MNKFTKAMTGICCMVLCILSLAPVFGVSIPREIWGIALGGIISIASNLVITGVERFEFKQPSQYKAKIVIESEEK